MVQVYARPPELENITLTAGQATFLLNDRKYCAAVTGIGGGKTLTGCLKAIRRYAETPGSLNLVCAPTFPMLRDTTIRTFFQLLPPHWVADWNQNTGYLRLTNGAEVLFRSLVRWEFIRGLTIASAYVDEAALIARGAWKVIKGRLRQQGFKPQAWLTSTPRGRNWLYSEFVLKATERHALIKWSGRENEKNLPEDFYEDLGFEGEYARQEIEGEFGAFEGLVYQFNQDGGLLDTHVLRPGKKRWSQVVGGIDWGFTNPAAIYPIGYDGDGRAWVLDEFYARHNTTTQLIDEIIEFTQKYKVETWFAGPDEPASIKLANLALDELGLDSRVVPADNDIRPGVQYVSKLLSRRDDGTRGLYVSPMCPNLINEFGGYAYPTTDSELRPPSEKPVKANDHAMDALRYGLYTSTGRGRSSKIATAVSRTSADVLDAELIKAQRLAREAEGDSTEALELEILRRTRVVVRFTRKMQRYGLPE